MSNRLPFNEEKLSPTISLIHPPPPPTGPSGASPHPAPALTILAAWMAAQEPHIRKYISGHHILFPTTPILLIECPLQNMISSSVGKSAILPAVPVVLKYINTTNITDTTGGLDDDDGKDDKDNPPELLIHMFSNGGSGMCSLLFDEVGKKQAEVDGSRRGRGNKVVVKLPRHAAILDSCPGSFGWRSSYAAMSAGLPKSLFVRAAAWPVLQGFIAMYFLRFVVLGGVCKSVADVFGSLRSTGEGKTTTKKDDDDDDGGKTVMEKIPGVDPLAVRANSHNLPLRREAEVGGRTYVYGPGDEMVDWRDVERHAVLAKAAGFEVRTEKFEGTAHVAHMRKDESRYWGIVAQRWGAWWERR